MSILQLLKATFWPTEENLSIDKKTFDELKLHAVASLPAPILHNLSLPSELKDKWKAEIIQQVANYAHYCYVEASIPLSVPYVILKGTSAAKYYSHPEYRTMGDIDAITSREDYEIACQELVDNGYKIIKSQKRETVFVKNDYAIELHHQFASLSNANQAQYLDELIYNNINPTHVLPDPINGLVLLEHISQHLENGLGLRQIIDWMMFVDKCLSDVEWPAFERLTENIGLTKLAIVITHMCEMYMGLPKRQWCAVAEEALCKQLMDYVLSCGNFGYKKTSDEDISENVFTYADTPKVAFKLLQDRGLINWKAAKKHKILRPFAWIYQANRYLFRGLRRENAVSKLTTEYNAAKRRKDMLRLLGVRTAREGIVIYKNGKYTKK